MKRHFRREEALEMVMQPLSDSELQDSSGETPIFEGESDTEGSLESSASVSASDPSSESEVGTGDPFLPASQWTGKCGLHFMLRLCATCRHPPA